MASEKESWSAGREAARDLTEHPEQPARHEEILARYLAGPAYAETVGHPRRRSAGKPVDGDEA